MVTVLFHSYLVVTVGITQSYACSYFGKLALKEMTFNPQKVLIFFFFFSFLD